MNTTTLFKKVPTPLKSLVLTIVHVVGALFTLLSVVVLLISVYHTLIFLIAKALTPLFLTVIPTVTLALCGGVIFIKQPVHNLLCLISIFFTTILLFLYAGAEFLAFLFLIVYVGAIAILFLFVIMLLNLKALVVTSVVTSFGTAFWLCSTAAWALLGLDDVLSVALTQAFIKSDTLALNAASISTDSLLFFVNTRFSDILVFSNLLYTYHCFLFFMSALILLTAMLGAIILATSATDIYVKTSEQINKN